ncbi:hypothetical protein [Bacillus pseudomycoides]|uniref:hypothetical protein n=1 Tax=Bacillus pseudomycoides TaxID=64104 RepID=UPI0011416C03|nr:hypothetical protein [Bacillus pseudomycoides]
MVAVCYYFRIIKSLYFQNIQYNYRAIQAIDIIHAIYKQKRSLGEDFVSSTYNELQKLSTVSYHSTILNAVL